MIAKFVTRSMQDVIDRLGGIPAFRIGTDPPPGLATEADVLRHLDSEDKRIYELVDGTLVEKPMGSSEDMMAAYLRDRIQRFADIDDLGISYCGAGAIKMIVGNIRIPDVSFFPWETLPEEKFPRTPFCGIAPALAIEILSESNTHEEMTLKKDELFKSGTKLVWIIDPFTRTAEVFTRANRSTVIDHRGVLKGGRILPGFQILLADIFDSLDRKTRNRKGK
jgi:Uma2 family endonuclease